MLLPTLHRIRAAIALLMGLFFTVSVATLTFVFAYKHGPWLWSRLSRVISHGLLAGIRYRVEGRVNPIQEGELVVVYANHQSTADLSEFTHYITHTLGVFPLFVVKADLYPMIRMPIDRIGVAVIINREDGVTAKAILRKTAERAMRERRVIVIFPDASRWCTEKAERDRKRYKTTPNITELTEHVLMPKTGGLFEILDALKGQPFRLIEVTNGLSVRIDRATDMLKLTNATFLLRAEEIDPRSIPTGKGARRAWLVRRFLAMSRRLALLRAIPNADASESVLKKTSAA